MKPLLLVTATMLAFIGTAAAADADLVATGDHSVWVITNDIKIVFEKETKLSLKLIPEMAIVGKGCQKGIGHASGGRPDREFGLICCTLDERTIENHGLKTYVFALEPLAIIVNRANPVKNLTLQQVKEIFFGKITNWKEVGGMDEKIAVITQLHCPNYTPNWKGILNTAERFTKNRVDVKTQSDMARTVSDFKQAIGHLEMTSVGESSDPVKVLSIDGYLPTTENVGSGRYPLVGKLAVTTKGDAAGKVVTFIEFMRTSPKVREAMKKYGMAQKER
jgi:hypothetical protein